MMTSSFKDNFAASNSWMSRAGVVVGYKPEDTMKSFLFNQNNKHCLNLNPNEIALLQFPQDEIERALDLLSSDSDSESSAVTKITVKNTSSKSDNSYINEDKQNSQKTSKSGTDIEIWHDNDNSDTDCTSADFSADFVDGQGEKLPFGNKSFEEILEEKLKQESNNVRSYKENSKSDSDSKPKFTFLKKNCGKSAWCSNIKANRNSSDKSNASSNNRSQSSDRIKPKKQQQSNGNCQATVRKMKSMPSASKKQDCPVNKSEKSLQKNRQKSVHFAATTAYKCDTEVIESKFDGPIIKTQINQKAAEIEDKSAVCTEESQNIDKELVEFELLEQIANVSISSSVASSIAMYDEENLREKLRKFKSMPPPTSCNQSKLINPQSKQVCENTNKEKNIVLSVCEEKRENNYSSNNYDTDVSDEEITSEEDNNGSQTTSNNTTTLSEFQESLICKRINIPFQNHKTQGITRKISKQDERYKGSNQDTEWTEESPYQLSVKNHDNIISTTSEMTIPKAQNIDWTFADPFHDSESSSDEENDFNENNNSNEIANLHIAPVYPTVDVDKKQLNPDDNITLQSVKLKQWVQLLENEVKRFKSENQEIEKLKKEKEDGLKRLEEEIKLFEKHKDEESKKFEEYKQNEIKKLKKERKVFEEYQEAMKNMPNKKDRQEIENLKSDIEVMKEESANKESRWQAANARLKQKVEQLESENSDLHSRIHALEQKRLQLQAQLVSTGNQKVKPDTNTQKPKQTVTSVSQAVSMKHSNIPLGSLTKEDNNSNKYVGSAAKTTNQIKKNHKPHNSGNTTKIQKPIKNNSNPFCAENGIVDIRGSAASDYYTGEEESVSIDLSKTQMNSSNIHVKMDPVGSIVKNLPFSIKIDRSNETIKDEVRHPDGILERIFMNGCIDVVYPNGSLKQISADGKSIIVHLFNGDIKQITPDGRVMYFYAQDESTQTTYPNGTEEILFKNGHKEILHASGIREINFPDKSVKILHPDSREETFLPNGLVIRISSTGDKEILLPNGQKEIHSNGIKKRIYPDGTTKTVYPDGRQETYYASGRMRVKDKHGNLLLDQYINKTSPLTNPN